MFKITNKNDFHFTGRYDGVNYYFPVGETVACDDAAANHIFGLHDKDKTAVFARHGWVPLHGKWEDGVRILANFKFDYDSPKAGAPLASDLAIHTVASGKNSGSAVGQTIIVHGPAPVVGDAGGGASAVMPPPPAVDEDEPMAPKMFKIETDVPIPPSRRA